MKIKAGAPKTLRAYCEAHVDQISEVDFGSGYATDTGFAYDILLAPGWRAYGDFVHTVIEPTVARTLTCLRSIEPCDCEDCRKRSKPP